MLLPFYKEGQKEAGCDEAGRGCLAGPVYAAAVILPEKVSLPGLDDSKKMSEKNRELLVDDIKEQSVAWAIASVSAAEIDEINILNASFLAMHRAIDALKEKPEFLLIDGNRFNAYSEIHHQCFVKGDGRFLSIAAASVLAKTARDAYMREIHKEYPLYEWASNKGYPTAAHIKAFREFGLSPHHRKTFHLKEQLKIPFA